MTDSAISGSMGDLRERELQKWEPDEVSNSTDLDYETFGKNQKWDQFAVNEELFGLKTNFEEEIYTTRLDRGSKLYREKEKIAEKLAHEIQKSGSSNSHLLEERGVEIDEDDLNEEDKYGAVVRSDLPDLERYVPPGLRKQVSKDSVALPKDAPIRRKFSIQTSNNYGAIKPEVDSTLIKVAEDFEKFSAQEKALLEQKKQALVKKERLEKIAEMKEFSKTFKLPENISSATQKETVEVKDSAPKPLESSKNTLKLSALASSFTPNANAAPFVPVISFLL